MRTIVLFALCVLFAFPCWGFEAYPTLSLHITSATYSGCATVDPSTMSCDDIDVEGDNSTTQFVFVFTSDLSAVAAVQFGVAYDPSITVQGWTLCTGGSEIPSAAWPDSGSGIAMTWPVAQYPTSSDSLLSVGFFTIQSGGTGVLSLTEDPAIGEAQCVQRRYSPDSSS